MGCEVVLETSQTTTTGPPEALLQPETRISGSTGEKDKAAEASAQSADKEIQHTDMTVVRA